MAWGLKFIIEDCHEKEIIAPMTQNSFIHMIQAKLEKINKMDVQWLLIFCLIFHAKMFFWIYVAFPPKIWAYQNCKAKPHGTQVED